jgi:putative endonuclease
MAIHNELGKKGEDLAADYLIKNGHDILLRNFRHEKAEVDIISSHNGMIVFTEVKTRSTDKFGYPEESIKGKKKDLLRIAMDFYLLENKIEEEARFDIISIVIDKENIRYHHIEDAFYH